MGWGGGGLGGGGGGGEGGGGALVGEYKGNNTTTKLPKNVAQARGRLLGSWATLDDLICEP